MDSSVIENTLPVPSQEDSFDIINKPNLPNLPRSQHTYAVDIPVSFQRRAPGVESNTQIFRQKIRKAFIRKVLSLLMIQLTISAIAIGITYTPDSGIREFIVDNKVIFYVALVIAILLFLIMFCRCDVVRKVPMNYLLLFAFTCSTSYILAYVASKTESDVVLFAGGFVVAVVISATLYATFAGNMNRMGFVFSGFFTMVIAVLAFGLIYRDRYVDIIYSGLIALMYSFFLAFDIQNLIGRYESRYSLDECINAALDIYVDIVQIFLILVGIQKE